MAVEARFVVVGPARDLPSSALPVPGSLSARQLVALALIGALEGRPGWSKPEIAAMQRQGGAWIVQVRSSAPGDGMNTPLVVANAATKAAARLTLYGRGSISVTLSKAWAPAGDRRWGARWGIPATVTIGAGLAVVAQHRGWKP